LIAAYVGQTAPKTREVCERAAVHRRGREAVAIFTAMAGKQGYRLAPDLAAGLPRIMAGLDRGTGFANGRSARGLLEQAIGAQALRLAGPDVDLESLADEELTLLTTADLPRQLP
jgi:hypothetical protein